MQATDRASNKLALAVSTMHTDSFGADPELACAAFELVMQGIVYTYVFLDGEPYLIYEGLSSVLIGLLLRRCVGTRTRLAPFVAWEASRPFLIWQLLAVRFFLADSAADMSVSRSGVRACLDALASLTAVYPDAIPLLRRSQARYLMSTYLIKPVMSVGVVLTF